MRSEGSSSDSRSPDIDGFIYEIPWNSEFQEELDDLVHDAAEEAFSNFADGSQLASTTNNQGVEDQVAFLVKNDFSDQLSMLISDHS